MKAYGRVVVLSLAGCAATTGVVQTGPDSFVASEMRAQALGGGPAAQAAVMSEAINFCVFHGLVFVPVSLSPSGYVSGFYGPTAYTATFRCLAPNDPEVARLRAAHKPFMDNTPAAP